MCGELIVVDKIRMQFSVPAGLALLYKTLIIACRNLPSGKSKLIYNLKLTVNYPCLICPVMCYRTSYVVIYLVGIFWANI